MTTFVFRQRDRRHVFITTEDPSYSYEWLCGCCDYPVELDDPTCPRCQRPLEECPVCSVAHHRRVVKVSPDQRGGRSCLSCGVIRMPFGLHDLSELQGTFCTNLFGCPAGGLILPTEELAILPENATTCPICEHPELKPLDIRTFQYHVNRCVFCSTIVDPEPGWRPVWKKGKQARIDVKGYGARDAFPCPICGRKDYRLDSSEEGASSEEPSDGDPEPGVSIYPGHAGPRAKDDDLAMPAYARLAELGQTLALDLDDESVNSRLFDIWNDPVGKIPERNQSISFAQLFDHLVRSTVSEETRRLLAPRRDRILDLWQRFFREGGQYRISF